MTKDPKTVYRYRAFSATTMDILCHDDVYFSNPKSFNDPLDCNPTLENDSPIEDLRKLLASMIARRVETEVLHNLQQAHVKGIQATEYVKEQAHSEAVNGLKEIAYSATDPSYGLKTEEAESWRLVEIIKHELDQHYERGVCCFSTTYKNPLLWSHYGDEHQGICIGYGLERNPKPTISKVVYGGSRSIKTSKLIAALLEKSAEAKKDLDRDILLRKASGWRYEREWRIIGERGIQPSPLLLKEVVFGLRCKNSIIHTVIKALSGRTNNMKFFKIFPVSGSYRLRREELDAEDLDRNLPNTAMSGIEIFGDVLGEKSTK